MYKYDFYSIFKYLMKENSLRKECKNSESKQNSLISSNLFSQFYCCENKILSQHMFIISSSKSFKKMSVQPLSIKNT